MLDKGHGFAGIVLRLLCCGVALCIDLRARLISSISIAIAKRGLSTSVTILFSGSQVAAEADLQEALVALVR